MGPTEIKCTVTLGLSMRLVHESNGKIFYEIKVSTGHHDRGLVVFLNFSNSVPITFHQFARNYI